MTSEYTMHRIAAQAHARKRFLERFNIKLDCKTKAYIVKCINSKNVCACYKQTSCRMLYVLTLCNKTVPIIYDTQLHEIITCLPSLMYLDWNKLTN